MEPETQPLLLDRTKPEKSAALLAWISGLVTVCFISSWLSIINNHSFILRTTINTEAPWFCRCHDVLSHHNTPDPFCPSDARMTLDAFNAIIHDISLRSTIQHNKNSCWFVRGYVQTENFHIIPGMVMWFSKNTSIAVSGSLRMNGTVESPIKIHLHSTNRASFFRVTDPELVHVTNCLFLIEEDFPAPKSNRASNLKFVLEIVKRKGSSGDVHIVNTTIQSTRNPQAPTASAFAGINISGNLNVMLKNTSILGLCDQAFTFFANTEKVWETEREDSQQLEIQLLQLRIFSLRSCVEMSVPKAAVGIYVVKTTTNVHVSINDGLVSDVDSLCLAVSSTNQDFSSRNIMEIFRSSFTYCAYGAGYIENFNGVIEESYFGHNSIPLKFYSQQERRCAGLKVSSTMFHIRYNLFENNTMQKYPNHLELYSSTAIQVSSMENSYNRVIGYDKDGISVYHNRFWDRNGLSSPKSNSSSVMIVRDTMQIATVTLLSSVWFSYNSFQYVANITIHIVSTSHAIDLRLNYWGAAIPKFPNNIEVDTMDGGFLSNWSPYLQSPLPPTGKGRPQDYRIFFLDKDYNVHITQDNNKLNHSTSLGSLKKFLPITIENFNELPRKEFELGVNQPEAGEALIRLTTLLLALNNKSKSRPWSWIRLGGLIKKDIPDDLMHQLVAYEYDVARENQIRLAITEVVVKIYPIRELRRLKTLTNGLRISGQKIMASSWSAPACFVSGSYLQDKYVWHLAFYYASILSRMVLVGKITIDAVEVINEPDGAWGTVILPRLMNDFLVALKMLFLEPALNLSHVLLAGPGTSQMNSGFQPGFRDKTAIQYLGFLLKSSSFGNLTGIQAVDVISFHSWDDVYLAWQGEQVLDTSLKLVRKFMQSHNVSKPLFVTEWGLKSPMLSIGNPLPAQINPNAYWFKIFRVSPEFSDGTCNSDHPWHPGYPYCRSYAGDRTEMTESFDSEDLSPLLVSRYVSRLLVLANHGVSAGLFWSLADQPYMHGGWGLFDRQNHPKEAFYGLHFLTKMLPKNFKVVATPSMWMNSAVVFAIFENSKEILLVASNPTPDDTERTIMIANSEMEELPCELIVVQAYIAATMSENGYLEISPRICSSGKSRCKKNMHFGLDPNSNRGVSVKVMSRKKTSICLKISLPGHTFLGVHVYKSSLEKLESKHTAFCLTRSEKHNWADSIPPLPMINF